MTSEMSEPVEALVRAARAYLRDTDNYAQLEQAVKAFPPTYIGSALTPVVSAEPAAQQPPFVKPDTEREFSGPFVDDGPPAQQPQSDLVRRAMLRARKIVEDHIAVFGMVPHPDKMKEAIAEALEAAAAQPSQQVKPLSDDMARLLGVLAEVKYRLGVVAEGCLRPWKDHHSSLELSLSDIRHEMQECIPFIADHIHRTKPPHEHSSPAAAQPSQREAALVKAARRWLGADVDTSEAYDAAGEVEAALAAYDTPAKDERRE